MAVRKPPIDVQGAIAVDGLNEALRGLGKVSREAKLDAVKALRELAKDPVTVKARANWASQRIRPTQAAKVIKWSASGTQGAAVVLKYGSFPSAAGVEFGSMQFRQFPRWTGNQFAVSGHTGLIVQDAIRDTLPQVEQRWLREVIEAILEATRRG